MDRVASDTRELGAPEESLSIIANDVAIECAAGAVRWFIPLDGNDSKYRVGSDTWKTASKWEGAALLINTLGVLIVDVGVLIEVG